MVVVARTVGEPRRAEPVEFGLANPTDMADLTTNGDTVVIDGSETGTDPLFGGVATPAEPGGIGTDIGTVCFMVQDMTVTGDVLAGPALVSEDGTVSLHVYWAAGDTDWTVTATVNGTPTTFSIAGAPETMIQFAVDGSGNTAVIIGDTIVGPNDQAVLSGLFAGKMIISGVMADPNGSTIDDAVSVEIDIGLDPEPVVGLIDDSVGLVGGTVGRLF